MGFPMLAFWIAYICFLFGALHLVYIFAVSAMKDLEGGGCIGFRKQQ